MGLAPPPTRLALDVSLGFVTAKIDGNPEGVRPNDGSTSSTSGIM